MNNVSRNIWIAFVRDVSFRIGVAGNHISRLANWRIKNFQPRGALSPSPLNAVRCVPAHRSRAFSIVSPTSSASPARHFQYVEPEPANLPKSFHAQSARPLTANSKTGASQYFATSNTNLFLHQLPVAPASRVGIHPTRGCTVPPRSKNPGSILQFCAGDETCRRRSADRAATPKSSFLPRWISCAATSEFGKRSSSCVLAGTKEQFKSSRVRTPLTLALSPLRGEGTRDRTIENIRYISR
jgi:hypothetical protein